MRLYLAPAAALLLAVSVRPASATAFQPGDVVVYNYDLTGGPFPPPFDHLTVTFNLANVSPGATGSFAYFDGLGATGAFFFGHATVLPAAVFTESSFGFSSAVDGVLSVRITAGNLPFEILSTTATAFGSPTGPPLFTVTATVAPTAAVPEPTTVALIASGLAAGVRAYRARAGVGRYQSRRRTSMPVPFSAVSKTFGSELKR